MTRTLKYILVAVLALGGNLFAAKHPVPLEKNTDSAKCVECHEDKSKGKVVHSAIATGCTSCHEIRVSKDVTRIKLTTTTTQALCFTCHSDKNPSQIKGKVHTPAIRDCAKCHDPHTTENKNQLLKATSGETKDQNLCLSCHKIGQDVPKGGSRHAALDSGCETCHTTHKVGDPNQREFKFHLNKATPQLCADCHDPKDAAIAKAHQNQPIDKADCMTCHDPHQSNGPKLVQKFAHQPFADKSCDACHAPAKDGKVVLTQTDTRALCLTCHDDKAKQIETAKVQHAGAQGACTDCHDAHAGKTQGFQRPDAVNNCLNCHADQAEQHKKAHLHQPAFEQGCSTCHEAHGSENKKLLRASTPNKLCLECHGPDAEPTKLEEAHLVTIFKGAVKLPEDYFRKVPKIAMKYGLGHPVDRHPVVDQMDPTDVTKVRVAIDCSTCHQPHASSKAGLLIKDQQNNMMFCASCHKDLGR